MQEPGISRSLADIILSLSDNLSFWEYLESRNITYALERVFPDIDHAVSLTEFSRPARIISTLVDSKSEYTLTHTSDLAAKALAAASARGYDDQRKLKFYFAALFHDIGKLVIPNRILHKKGALNSEEMQEARKHVYYTEKTLWEIGFDREIISWAANHHERLDGSGYPRGLTADQLDRESRTLAVLDVYQSLTEDRPYWKAKTHGEAAAVLSQMAEQGYLNSREVEEISLLFSQSVTQ